PISTPTTHFGARRTRSDVREITMGIRRFTATFWLLVAPLFPLCATANCVMGISAELKVTMDGMRPTIAAKINGRDAKFVADSGAFYSVIGTASAEEYDLRTTPAPASVN